MLEMQMEIYILKETFHVFKKDSGIDQIVLSNRDKAVIIDALKTKYSLPLLLEKLQLLLSRKSSISAGQIFSLQIRIKELFTENKNRYGYRRIHALLKREDMIVSEKIVCRIMHGRKSGSKRKKNG